MISKVLRWWRNWKFDRLVARSPLGTPQALARQAQTPPKVKVRFRERYVQTGEKPPGPIDVPPAENEE